MKGVCFFVAKWKRENNTGTIYKMSGNRRKPWAARISSYDENRVPHSKYIGSFKTYEEASAALAKARSGPRNFTETVTMDELFYILYEKKKRQGLTESSLKAVNTNYNHIKSLGKYNFLELSTYDFQQIIDNLIDEGSSFSKVSKIKSTINQLYDVAIENKILDVNYAQYIDVSQAIEGQKLPFPNEDIKKIFANDNERIAKASLILIMTGLRIGTFLNLSKTKNIFLKDNMIVAGSKTIAGKNRKIPIHPIIFPYIEYFYNEFPNSDLLFSRNGENVTSDYYRKYYHKPFIKKLGLSDYTPHSFRHNTATLLRECGAADITICLIMGHTDDKFTDKRYVGITDDFLQQEVRKIQISTDK